MGAAVSSPAVAGALVGIRAIILPGRGFHTFEYCRRDRCGAVAGLRAVPQYRPVSFRGACNMFGNVFNKDAAPVPAAQPLSGISEAELQAWRERILAAEGDDRALLKLAHQ